MKNIENNEHNTKRVKQILSVLDGGQSNKRKIYNLKKLLKRNAKRNIEIGYEYSEEYAKRLDKVISKLDKEYSDKIKLIPIENMINDYVDVEANHIEADNLSTEILLSLGFTETVKEFSKLKKYYG
jgi:sulfatase maturation enzyme AslB (radical SAM superfamily)